MNLVLSLIKPCDMTQANASTSLIGHSNPNIIGVKVSLMTNLRPSYLAIKSSTGGDPCSKKLQKFCLACLTEVPVPKLFQDHYMEIK